MKPPSLSVIRERNPSPMELYDFFRRAGMSNHARLVFLSFGPDEQARLFAEWHAEHLAMELKSTNLREYEVVSERAYRSMPWCSLMDRKVEFFG